MARFYYRFDCSSELGKKFRTLWNICEKADRAAEVFAAKVGAQTYYSSPLAFAGCVECVSFEDTESVNRKIWKSMGKDADGYEQWVPIVSSRSDVLILPRKDFKPSDTATRIYEKRSLSWAMVSYLHSMKEWAEIVQMPLTGDEKKDKEQLDKVMNSTRFVKYIELYRDDTDSIPADRRVKMPYFVRESIRIERARMLLPVVKMESFYSLLQTDFSGVTKDGEMSVVKDSTPTFFEYNKRIYLGIEYPCSADGLKEISSIVYITAKEDMLKCQRDMEALEKKGGVN